jgi:succinate dehydrogenase / fumarate reductase iron-sulfur subunit
MDKTFRVFRGDRTGGDLVSYRIPVTEGMTVLDGILYIQARLDGALACRWNCKAGRCGSCGAEVDGHPCLLCKTLIDGGADDPIAVRPMQAFPVVKDLVCDLSENYRVNAQIVPFTPFPDDQHPWGMRTQDVTRTIEFRKCIECFLCQDACHVVREHGGLARYIGPRFMVRVAALNAHPKDVLSRTDLLRSRGGLAYCDITGRCQDVCPERIRVTDRVMFPLKQRSGDDYLEQWRAILRPFGEVENPRGGG